MSATKDHEVEALKRSGLLKEPESNKDIDDALSWFYGTLRYRRVNVSEGVYVNIIPSDIDELLRVEATRLSDEYLYYIMPVFDSEYTNFLRKP